MFRPFGTLSLLSNLMCEVVKVLMMNNTEEGTWSWEARDILLDTWTTLLVVCNFIPLEYFFIIFIFLPYACNKTTFFFLTLFQFICQYPFQRLLLLWFSLNLGNYGGIWFTKSIHCLLWNLKKKNCSLN